MGDVKFNSTSSRMKRTTYDEDRVFKDEPPFKSQRIYQQNDDQYLQDQNDTQFESSEITEHNYKRISATTVYKKLQVLEIRDKILRASTTLPTKDINLDEIKPMVGTCQDMCPEKERLLRIHGNMVSPFECKMTETKLEPVFELMVKQYARSSADQANPLSQELRPTSILVKTMHYMLKNVIYPIESNIEQDLAGWYDFCWDRLRAIRKDIVQQNLQNSEVVTILEQIGRFHIACYDLLLGYTGFDIKLNTENLNNCIQMLMPMYRESEQPCPNEPEFVSYELLMHLGNPQFHTAYDLLPIHIKQTPQVRFCIKAHTTYLQSSDCKEFFSLLRSTTFMNCCILQRVIPDIRYNNIKMINMSYTTVKRVYKFELDLFMEKLCFDDKQYAQEFFSDIQLQFNETHVDLSRNIAIRPPELRRQKQESIISEKRQNLTYLISRIENMPDVIISPVHSSFDSNNRFYDHANDEVNKDLDAEISDSEMVIDTFSPSNSKDDNTNQQLLSTTPIQTPVIEIPTFTFTLPKFSLPTQVQKPFINFEWNPPPKLSTFQDILTSDKSDLSSSLPGTSNLTSLPVPIAQDVFIKPPSPSPINISPIQQSHPQINLNKKPDVTQLIEHQTNLTKKYFEKWQDFVNLKKSMYIEEMFAHGDLFHSECISSLSSSPSSTKSLSFVDEVVEIIQEEPKEWLNKQYILAEKYFFIWLRKVLRRRRKIEIDPVCSMPWSVFMQVHGTPKETFSSTNRNLKSKRQFKTPFDSLNSNNSTEYDISVQIANIFVKNVKEIKKDESVGKKIFWKLAINYGDTPEPYCIEKKVLTIIYGKLGFSNNQIQTIYTDYNAYFIKTVHSCIGQFDWTNNGLNAALIFTNTDKEDVETLFKRVDLILQSTPTAIPLVMIFSSKSDKNSIKHYEYVLDGYKENEYINNYSVYIWEGPKTILESIEFFSKHFVDLAPGIRVEKLYYNLLNFSQHFFVKVRSLLSEDNPNIIIEKYNQCLDAYMKRLGRNNQILTDLAPDLVPYYTQNPDEFSKEYSNFNLKYFEDLLSIAHLLPYESWPPKNVDDLMDYVKNMCKLSNRRSWCLDILQMLQLYRQADLDYCLLNASWYEPIEMWIEGTLEKCSIAQNDFTVFYNGDPINDVLNMIFSD
ncbi:uncharacterized protein LOC112595634 [Melanaphis sacchari]|uniref:MCM3-associated protein n=2 Tax=Melanaphis sacchari TaxID=742174 RepID=A0A2H8THF6_9HEMI|nr:uncharacterized protein LOC112595634 [Melanaphis sacchari]XP_025196701.1 uncharacterized protein LOC112595634 [Melanaphis sacchari]